MILLLWIVLFLVIVPWFYKKWKIGQKFVDLPGPAWYASLPLIGHSYLLGSNPGKTILELRSE